MTLFVKTTGQLAPLCSTDGGTEHWSTEEESRKGSRRDIQTFLHDHPPPPPAAMPFLTKDVFQITPKSTVSVDSLNWSSLITELLLCILLLLLLLLLAAAFT